MKLGKKRFSVAIAFALTFIYTATLVMSATYAQPLGEYYEAFAYSFATPTKVGLHDPIYLGGWVTPGPAIEGEPYYNYTFIITRPDGTQDEVFFPTSNIEASRSFSYVCDQEGQWNIVLSFPGDLIYELRSPAVSPPFYWTVEEGYEVPVIENQPLPTYPWKYPISSEYWEWYQISGSWSVGAAGKYNSSGTNFNPYSKGPNSPHVLWKLPWTGGLLGGETGYLAGGTDVPGPCVAAQGKIYFEYTEGRNTAESASTRYPVLICLDQVTGEQIFKRELWGSGSIGKMYFEFQGSIKERSQEQPELLLGPAAAYSLWTVGGGLREIDPLTGDTKYYLPGPGNGLFSDGWGFDAQSYWILSNYPQRGNVSRFNCRTKDIQWTVDQWPTEPAPGSTTPGSTGTYIWQDRLICLERYVPTRVWNTTTGEQILEGPITSFWPIVYRTMAAYGNVYWDTEEAELVALSIETGQEVWRSPPQSYPWGAFNAYTKSAAYGFVYINSYDGYIYCYNGATGALEWKTFTGNTTETASGAYPLWGNTVVADGKLYVASGEHTYTNPRPRGHSLWSFDAFSGDILWQLEGFAAGEGGISSGMLWYTNEYDGSLYMFGRGESKTTVEASPKVVANGASVLIEGTVTDQSAGAKDTPAISDEYMSDWMGYLYMNKPMPAANGVSVALQAVRSDGTVFDIAHATSDVLGHYEYLWTPPDEDTYKILATFEGSEAYWPSSSETAVGVTEAPSPGTPIPPTTEPPTTEPPTTEPPTTEPPTTEPPTTEPPTTPPPTSEPPTEAPVISTEVAIAVAVAVVAVVGIGAYWVLRRQRSK